MKFTPGKTLVQVAGSVFDDAERIALIETAGGHPFAEDFYLDTSQPLQLCAGRRHHELERELAKRFGVKHALLVNSGSSANLLAFEAMRERYNIPRGSRILTVACGFPTTIAPIVQAGCIPVFVDVGPDGNVDVDALVRGWMSTGTQPRGIVLAHALGFPFDLDRIRQACADFDIPLLADCCDAAGAQWRGKEVTALAEVSTLSFYPAHHMTTGEGGCVLTDDDQLAVIVRSLRDWGRSCDCPPGHDNTCGKRFDQPRSVLGSLPEHYDHKYVYQRFGYNMKMTEMQAAIGLAQLGKLDGFITRRRQTWLYYRDRLSDLGTVLDFPQNGAMDEPPPGYLLMPMRASPFGFLITVRPDAPFTRAQLVYRLEVGRRIQTRPLFAGDLTKHPALRSVSYEMPGGTVPWTNVHMNRSFWIGVYPGITDEMREWVVRSIHEEVEMLTKEAKR